MTPVDEATSIVGAPREHVNPVLTVDHPAKIAHFQEQNKLVSPNDEFSGKDWVLALKNALMKGKRGQTICAPDHCVAVNKCYHSRIQTYLVFPFTFMFALIFYPKYTHKC